MKKARDALIFVFALPLAQLYWIVRYANTKDTTAAKVGMALTFIPVFLFTTLLWSGTWLLLFTAARALIRYML